jgi:hypothetical protein
MTPARGAPAETDPGATALTARQRAGTARRVAFGLAALLLVAGLLAWAACAPWQGPWTPRATMAFAGDDFDERLGTAFGLDGRLQVIAPGAAHTNMQTRRMPPFEAREYPILSYRFDDFPPQQELAFVFRRTDQPDDVVTITLPRPTRGASTFDLGRLDAWRGAISEIGFAQYPTPQLVPASFPAATFVFDSARLESRSIRGALAALASDWFGYRPWGLFSVSSVDLEAGPNTPRAPSPVLVTSLALGGSALLGCVLLGWRPRTAAIRMAGFVALAWLLLDAVQLGRLADRLVVTRALYAGQPWDERERRMPNEEIRRAADHVRSLLDGEPRATRILVWADSAYVATRLYYDLLPLNVAFLATVIDQAKSPPAPSVIVLYDTDWSYDAGSGVLQAPGAQFDAQLLDRSHALAVYRVTEGTAR